MKYKIFAILMLMAILIPKYTFSDLRTITEDKKKILIIHSYQMDYEWTATQDSGITEAFNENFGSDPHYELERIFLDGKKKSEKLSEPAVQKLISKIQQIHPVAVITTDDLAFKIFHNFLRDQKIPIGFTGINGHLEDYGYVAGEKGITGSLERYNIMTTVMILKKIRPDIEEILLVSEPSITGKTMMADFKKQLSNQKMLKNIGINKIKEFVSDRFPDLKKFLLAVHPNKTAVIFVAIYTYRDARGNPVSHKVIDEWINTHTQFLDVGTADFNVKDGRLLSLASSGKELGYYSANTLFQAIKKDIDPSEYPIRQYLPLKLSINQSKLLRLKLNVPYEVLVYAKALNKLNEVK